MTIRVDDKVHTAPWPALPSLSQIITTGISQRIETIRLHESRDKERKYSKGSVEEIKEFFEEHGITNIAIAVAWVRHSDAQLFPTIEITLSHAQRVEAFFVRPYAYPEETEQRAPLLTDKDLRLLQGLDFAPARSQDDEKQHEKP